LKGLKKLLGAKYVLQKRPRQVTAGVQKPPAANDLSVWDLHSLEQHVRGRGEESVRVLLGVAFLRKAGLVGRDDVVGYTGAEFQRGQAQGSRGVYVAAHRLPCNATIRNWGLPHFADSPGLRRALELPLEKTDYLPKLVNYADRLFERSGACEALAAAVGFVLHEQKPDKDVNVNMIRHATIFELFNGKNGYLRAYEMALDLARANTNGIDLLDPATLAHVSEMWSSQSDDENVRNSRKSMDLVEFALSHSIDVMASGGDPFMLAPATASQHIARFERLHKGF
jgi:hypothetical protein